MNSTTGAAELPEALPRYREYMHLRTTGAWSSGVPAWAKDYSGLMNDMTAAHAVIEELHAKVEALSAAQAGVPAEATVNRETVIEWLDANDIEVTDRQIAGLFHAAAPQPNPSPAPADPDGEAFRTAARLGLTLRFYGGCAQSSIPGTPSAYEVVPGCDRAEAMRKAVAQAAEVIAAGGKAQECGNSPYDEGPFTMSAPAQPGQEGEEGELQPCPCGKTPTALQITGDEQAKWAHVSGNCCGTWEVEYRNNYAKLASPEAMALAKSAWNDADRAARAAPQPATADAARQLFDAGWKAAARFCGRDDVVADGVIGFGACPQFEAAFKAAIAAQREVKP